MEGKGPESSSGGDEHRGYSETRQQGPSGFIKGISKAASNLPFGNARKPGKDDAKRSQPREDATKEAPTAGGTNGIALKHDTIGQDQKSSDESVEKVGQGPSAGGVRTQLPENADGFSVPGTRVVEKDGEGLEAASVPPNPAASNANSGFRWQRLFRNEQKEKEKNERDNLKKKTEEMATEIESLKKENKHLRVLIEAVESRHRKATPAHGVYSGSEANPVLLQMVANDVKRCSSNLAATMRGSMGSEAKELYRIPRGIALSQIKLTIQEELCSLAFEGLWETDDLFFYQCLPEDVDLEQSQQAQFNRYKHIESLLKSDVLNTLVLGEQKLQGCGSTNSCTACSSGEGGNCPELRSLVDLRKLFKAKYEKIIETEKLSEAEHEKLIETKNLPWAKVPESELKKGFLQFIVHVWLAHRLTLSFEQPAALFKVKRGQKYVPDYMEAVHAPEGDSERTVAFMIIPGFRVGKACIKSVVHLAAPENVIDQGA